MLTLEFLFRGHSVETLLCRVDCHQFVESVLLFHLVLPRQKEDDFLVFRFHPTTRLFGVQDVAVPVSPIQSLARD